jgi:hypothetical protein
MSTDERPAAMDDEVPEVTVTSPFEVSDYEKERQRRILENQRILSSLNIHFEVSQSNSTLHND